jgi:outer membrane protein assembly factor BamD (BamD/ComL family)
MDDDYKVSVETYQTLIRRFPKHPLACESYIGVGKVYLTQCKNEYPDPDFLDLSEINLRKFRQDFPNEPRVSIADSMLMEMKELYAKNLYETAQFYERTKKPNASMIYYSKILSKYPQTKIAQLSQKRLEVLQSKRAKLHKSLQQVPVQQEAVIVDAKEPEQLPSSDEQVSQEDAAPAIQPEEMLNEENRSLIVENEHQNAKEAP